MCFGAARPSRWGSAPCTGCYRMTGDGLPCTANTRGFGGDRPGSGSFVCARLTRVVNDQFSGLSRLLHITGFSSRTGITKLSSLWSAGLQCVTAAPEPSHAFDALVQRTYPHVRPNASLKVS